MSANHLKALTERLRITSGEPPIVRAREGATLEFKQSFNWRAREEYAKTLAAFSNNAGGYLVFGVGNNPRELLGLQGSAFESRDDATITEFLNNAFAPEIVYERDALPIGQFKLGFIHVQVASRKPVICLKNGSEIKEGEIYYRYRARSERIRYPELASMIRKIEEAVERRWMDLHRQIARIGLKDAQVLSKGELPVGSGDGLTVVTASKDAKAPAVVLTETDYRREFPLTYAALYKSLYENCENFKANYVFHAVMREINSDPALCYTRLLDPDKPKSGRKRFYAQSAVSQACRLFTVAIQETQA